MSISTCSFNSTTRNLGNILIPDEPDKAPHVGFIHDFDYSAMEPDETDPVPPQGDKYNAGLKERTGTYFYMALELINPEPNTFHHPHHDLESFYWVLLWAVLRHIKCHSTELGEKPGQAICLTTFKSYDGKCSWLHSHSRRLNVPGNNPLMTLLRDFRALVVRAFNNPGPADQLTVDGVLKLFDDAIDLDGWPTNDWIPCTLLEGTNVPTGITPIQHDVPPGYEEPPSDERRLRAHSSQIRVSSGQAGFAGPSTSRGLPFVLPPMPGSTSRGRQDPPNSSGSKRSLDEIAYYPHPLDESRPGKRSKTTMDPPPRPSGGAKSKTSSRGGRRRGSGVVLQATRSSDRIKAQNANASGSHPAA
ncbi:hypothetical protein BC628DRAFT_1419030 [Trametes gibbosa]|nr:hypothetical protein BC628DRAFT_1419030 [Trametes gibbosa]